MVMIQATSNNYVNFKSYKKQSTNIAFKSRTKYLSANTIKDKSKKVIPFFVGLLALLKIKPNDKKDKSLQGNSQTPVSNAIDAPVGEKDNNLTGINPTIENKAIDSSDIKKDDETEIFDQEAIKAANDYPSNSNKTVKNKTKIERTFEMQTFYGDPVDITYPHETIKETDENGNIIHYRETGLAKDITANSTSYRADLSDTIIEAQKDGDDVIFTYTESPYYTNPTIRKFNYSAIKQLGLTEKEVIECLNTQPQIRRNIYANIFDCVSEGKDFGHLLKSCYIQLPNQESEFTKIIRMANPNYVDKVPAQEALEKIYKYHDSTLEK